MGSCKKPRDYFLESIGSFIPCLVALMFIVGKAFFGLAFKYNSKYTLGKKLDPESCSSAAFIAST